MLAYPVRLDMTPYVVTNSICNRSHLKVFVVEKGQRWPDPWPSVRVFALPCSGRVME